MLDQIENIQLLQGCLNDLVSLLSLPALWSNHEPPEVLGILLDVLLRMLQLDFAYARLNVAASTAPSEMYRVAERQKTTPESQEIGRALKPWLRLNRPGLASVVPNPVGKGEVTMVCIWLGLGPERGVVVVGSKRANFPTDIERLLLKSAVNQAVIELQRAEVLAERDRAAAIEHVKNRLLAENLYLRQELDSERHWEEIVGQSKVLKKVLDLVEQVAPTKASVLIQGETGTGKELIARAIHRLSGRREQAFVKLNCAAIPTGLLEAELFGHEKGAFTGAIGRRIGRFELAHQGTIFLDEVGEIPLELQAKLLRVLQEQEFERLGSPRTIRIDVRIVAASNRDLAQMVADQGFRSDLYYRLNVFPIVIPPLRERVEDIPQLVRYFTERHARQYNKPITSIPAETMTALCRYPWPGNVRELENFIERSVILSQGSTLEVPLGELKPVSGTAADGSTLKDFEREHILRALNECHWVIAGPSGAAAKLGMKRTSLQYRMQKLGITRPPDHLVPARRQV
jgi:formate hydrogenlyase transcriptional activator